MRLDLRIERLVVEGLDLPASETGLLTDAVLSQLRLILQDAGVTRYEAFAVPELRAASVEVARDPETAELGRKVAVSIGNALLGTRTSEAPAAPERGSQGEGAAGP